MKPIHTRNKLPGKLRQQIAALLNQTTASTIDLRYQSKEAHWNVRGPQFRSLHKLFDKLSKHCDKHLDIFAERCVQLGFTVDGRIQDANTYSQLEEYPPDVMDGMEHVHLVANRLSHYCEHLYSSCRRCGELDEPATQDIYVQAIRDFDESLWMIESYLFSSTALGAVSSAASGTPAEGKESSEENKEIPPTKVSRIHRI